MKKSGSEWRVNRPLALVALGGIVGFVLALGALHFLQRDLSPLTEAMSYYVHGSGGWLMTLALVGLGVGSLALTVAFVREGGQGISRAGCWCLGVWSVGVLLGAAFAADPPGRWDQPPSISGAIHGLAAMVALVIFPIAAILLSRSVRARAPGNRATGALWMLAVISAASLILFLGSVMPVFFRPGPPVLLGLTERILFVSYLVWLAVATRVVVRPREMGMGRP